VADTPERSTVDGCDEVDQAAVAGLAEVIRDAPADATPEELAAHLLNAGYRRPDPPAPGSGECRGCGKPRSLNAGGMVNRHPDPDGRGECIGGTMTPLRVVDGDAGAMPHRDVNHG
jgi:hypothetical protein